MAAAEENGVVFEWLVLAISLDFEGFEHDHLHFAAGLGYLEVLKWAHEKEHPEYDYQFMCESCDGREFGGPAMDSSIDRGE
jgi:hypothetical protein